MDRPASRLVRASLLAALLPFAFVACSDDDGADVREIADDSSGSGSATRASGSGAASGASGSGASASEPAKPCTVTGGTSGSGFDLRVVFDEWVIAVSQSTVPEGKVTFESINEGAVVHELVLIKGAKEADLEIGDEGLDESELPEGAEVVGEVEPIPAGDTCTDGTYEVEAGDYVLICNIVEDADGGSHAVQGMVTDLTVQ